MNIRYGTEEDADNLLDLMTKLDYETKNMLFEPGERSTNSDGLKNRLSIEKEEQLMLLVEDHNKLCGFLSAQRGHVNRIKHTSYIVVGLLEEIQGRGIGTKLFEKLEQWAKENQITRLELTVVETNGPAIHLYEKMGYIKEGLRRNSMIVDGSYVNEFYMSKLID